MDERYCRKHLLRCCNSSLGRGMAHAHQDPFPRADRSLHLGVDLFGSHQGMQSNQQDQWELHLPSCRRCHDAQYGLSLSLRFESDGALLGFDTVTGYPLHQCRWIPLCGKLCRNRYTRPSKRIPHPSGREVIVWLQRADLAHSFFVLFR